MKQKTVYFPFCPENKKVTLFERENKITSSSKHKYLIKSKELYKTE